MSLINKGFTMSLFELAGSALQLASSIRGIEERQENVRGLSQTIAYVKKGVAMPFTLCHKVTQCASEYLTSGVIKGARHIPGVQSLIQSHCRGVSLRCASKCRKHASQLSTLIPKNDGMVSAVASYFSASTSQSALSPWFGANSPMTALGAFLIDKVVAPSLSAKLDAQLADAIFYPVVCKLHELAGQSIVKMGVDIAICSTINVAVGGVGLTGHIAQFQKATTIAQQATSATMIGVHAYVYGQPIMKGGKFVLQSCLKARQIKKIDAALDQLDLTPLIENIKGFNIPLVNQAARPLVKGVLIALIDSGLCGTIDFAALVGNKKKLNFWLSRQVEMLTVITSLIKQD
jgi:hypothetical protein